MTTEHRDSDNSDGNHARVAEELKHDADRLRDTIGERAKGEAESRKGQAAHVAGSASHALNTVAKDLADNPDVPDWMTSALQQTARKIESLANHVDGRSIDQLGRDVSEFARRSPGTFLAASAAAGFAAARVLRAGVDKKRHDHDAEQDATGQSGNAANWPADEHVKPTSAGGFAPSYGNEQGEIGSFGQ